MNDYIAWGVLISVYVFGVAPIIFAPRWCSYTESLKIGLEVSGVIVGFVAFGVIVSLSVRQLMGV